MKKRFLIWQAAVGLAIALRAISLQAAGNDIDRKIQPGDTVIIEVYGEEKLTRTLRVQVGGTITYPLLKQVQVAGKTTPEVEAILTEKLGERYLRNPEVTVTVKEYRSRTVTVLGAIDIRGINGGSIELPSEQPMDILEAIAKAGGFSVSKVGRNPRIELTRKGKVTHYKFDDLRKETDPSKKVWLEPGDVIFLPEPFL
jgi:polysaccharide biosynthesis/export protein